MMIIKLKKIEYNFSWFLERIRRLVPATSTKLEYCYTAVFKAFCDIVCTKSGKKLFSSPHAMKTHINIQAHSTKLCIGYPANTVLYSCQ